MALNIAVPLSGEDEFLDEDYNEILPSMNIDCRSSLKIVCSPIESESSGISSLDSEEIKKSSASSSPTDEEPSSDQGDESSPLTTHDESSDEAINVSPRPNVAEKLLSPKPKHPNDSIDMDATAVITEDEGNITSDNETDQSLQHEGNGEAIDDEKNDDTEFKEEEEEDKNEMDTNDDLTDYYSIEEQRKLIARLRIELNGRNILDLGANLRETTNNTSTDMNEWNQQGMMQYAMLPENNLKLFFANRSQYHRLGANGHIQEYALVKCKSCDFMYPVNGYNTNTYCNIDSNVKNTINNGNDMTAKDMMAANNVNAKKDQLSDGILAFLKEAEFLVPSQPQMVQPQQQQQQQHNPPHLQQLHATPSQISPPQMYNRPNLSPNQNNYNHPMQHNNPNSQAALNAAVNLLFNNNQQFIREPNFNTYNNNANNITALNRIFNNQTQNNNNNSNNNTQNNNLNTTIESLAAALLTTPGYNNSTTTNHGLNRNFQNNNYNNYAIPSAGYYKQF